MANCFIISYAIQLCSHLDGCIPTGVSPVADSALAQVLFSGLHSMLKGSPNLKSTLDLKP